MGNSTRISLFVALVLAFLTAAGCGSRKAPDTQTATPARIGVIYMDKAVKAHPKYADYLRLQREYTALAARIQAEKAQGISAAGPAAGPTGQDGMLQAANKEFNARMAAKEAEVKTQLAAAADKERQAANAELDAYGRELDKEYQPQLFNIQLKQKTVRLSKEEAAALEAEVAKLKEERAGKLAARQKELQAKMNADMAAKEAQSRQELKTYAGTVNTELADEVKTQQAEAAGRLTAPGPAPGGEDAAAGELAAKRQEMAALQASIVSDIRDKVAKVAAEQKLGTVLVDVKVNVSAPDITSAVIAEFKK